METVPMKKIVIYTKWCLGCMWPEESRIVLLATSLENARIKVRRVTYRPDWERIAARLYGSEDYDAFVVINKKVIDYMEFAKQCKNKLIKAGIMKDIEGDTDDMPKLQRTKRPDRAPSEVVEGHQDSSKNGTQLEKNF